MEDIASMFFHSRTQAHQFHTLTTGEGSVYETYSKSNDVLIGLDDAL